MGRSAVAPQRTTKNRSALAPGQRLGYAVQDTRLLDRLLDAERGEVLSIEVLGDVASEKPDGLVLVEEDKSTLGQNPVGNRAAGLWKSLANWVVAVRDGTLKCDKTLFVLYVTAPKSGTFVESFHSAATLPEATAAIIKARDALWGAEPEFPRRARVPASLASHLDIVFGIAPSEMARILLRFSLLRGSGRPQVDLTKKMRKLLIADDILEDVLHWAIGWVKRRVDGLQEAGQAARLEADEFRSELLATIRALDQRTLLVGSASLVPSEAVAQEMEGRTYLHQLDLIDSDYNEKLAAATDFLRAASARVGWSKKGWVQKSNFDDFETELSTLWRLQRTNVHVGHADRSDVDQGKLLYARCCTQPAQIAGVQLEGVFIRGSYHALADDLSVGWHPHFDALLSTAPPSKPDPEDQ